MMDDCTTKESDYRPRCENCMGWGHKKDKCATEEAVLAQVVSYESDGDSVTDQAFCAVAQPPGECGIVDLGLVGVEELGQDVMQYVADTAATCSMFRCANAFENYRECNGWVRGIGGDKAPVPLLGYGDVVVVLKSEGGWVPVPIPNAAHVPEAPYNLISLTTLAEEGHKYSGEKGGLTLTTKAGGEVFFPRMGKLLTQEGYQTQPTVDIACAAVIVPGDAKAATTPTNLNDYHNSHGHVHEELLKRTAKQQGVQLEKGPLAPCLGCSMSKGQVKPIKTHTDSRAVKKLFRTFLDLGGKMQFKSLGGNWYTLIIRDDHSRWTRVFFLKHKYDAAVAFEQYMADYREYCVRFSLRVQTVGESSRANSRKFAADTASSKSSHRQIPPSTTVWQRERLR